MIFTDWGGKKNMDQDKDQESFLKQLENYSPPHFELI